MILGSCHTKECHEGRVHTCKLFRPLDTVWSKCHHHVAMNFRGGRKQMFYDSFGSEHSNKTSIHSVSNIYMTVLNIVGNMKMLPTYGQCIQSHSPEKFFKAIPEFKVYTKDATNARHSQCIQRAPSALDFTSRSYNMRYTLFLNIES